MGPPHRAKGNNREATPNCYGARQEEGRQHQEGKRITTNVSEGGKLAGGGKKTFGTELKWSSNPNRRTANSGRNVRAIVVFGRSGHSSAGHGSCLIRESSSSSTKPKTQQPIFIHRYPRLPRRGGGGRFSRPVRPSSPLQIPARCLAWPRLALNPSVASPHHPGGWMNNSPLAPRTSFLLGLKNRCILPESSTSSHR
ncbi:hypothetical protein ASPNIDRAFT_42369 [Aspergillus niger ATCC 1015]|uniref:Uncharacterized protein n=1 Tax=Aspergillus niger (strain ATCC 1015 / CBS 113.46 / FGSC A1144 / LSHB Ac4 / NCTC 3858a / NRRL 328 / USDA 3528.7) TaxID=380704 RepID=G3XVL8_ASPNA|nr:hypothetical protein ASPNIDRAFT_42369 [Aspergillus niger ATCC 1015]